jgi:subtilisin family serine protease
MATGTRARPKAEASEPPPPSHALLTDQPEETTGRFLVLFREGELKEGVRELKRAGGLERVANSTAFTHAAAGAAAQADTEIVVFEKLGVAVVNGDPGQLEGVAAATGDEGVILAVEPERIVRTAVLPYGDPAGSAGAAAGTGPADFTSYLTGYRDAVNHLFDKLMGGTGEGGAPMSVGAGDTFADTPQFTWGLQATKVASCRVGGQNVRIAVLDTGIDLEHPDLRGRVFASQSFITGQTVQDGNRHGTHCAGTAAGPLQPATGVRRYGCAYQATLLVGKVLGNAGSGTDTSLLEGIDWAIRNECRIVSMSIQARVATGQAFSRVFENAARRALAANTLIVAAAGNFSARPTTIAPVTHPANCPSILAVASVDSQLRVSPFSCGAVNPGGNVDVAGPGSAVFSAVPVAFGSHGVLSGTSMATPHVAGIAALHLQARGPATSAPALWQILTSTALRLNLPARDVGAGLAQAPV